MAQWSAPPSEPANNALFFRLSAIERMECSTVLLSKLDAAIIDEARQPLPARERMTDGVGKPASQSRDHLQTAHHVAG